MIESEPPLLGEPTGVDTLPDAIPRLEAYLAHSHQDPEQRVLYEEQIPIMENMFRYLNHFGVDLRGRISVPTGVGKTVLFTELLKATGLRALVVTPSQILVEQTAKAFGKFGGDEDISVGKVYADEKAGDTDITITTYNSFVQHTEAGDSPYIRPENYDVIILDEAHHALSDKRQAALKKYAGTAIIGLTATDKFSTKKQLSDLLPHEIHNMHTREAIESGLIAPYSVVVVETETDMSSVKISTTNEYDQEDLQKVINSEARNQVAVEIYIKYFADKKVVFSCGGVQHAKDMAKLLQECGVAAEAIYGDMPKTRRRDLIEAFADQNPDTGVMVLCNDKLLAEGFDEVSLAACFNLAPTLSKVRSQQRSGRALRLNPNDPAKHALILEFVDRNYRKPPVLFADPDVAGSANIGGTIDLSRFEQTFKFNIATARVITDPEQVEQLATSFAEARSTVKVVAPEDWLTVSAIAKNLNVPVTAVRKALEKVNGYLPDFVEENSGKFTTRGVKDGTTTHFSPLLVEGMELFIQKPEVAPEKWLTAHQVAARYDIDSTVASRHLNRIANKSSQYTGQYVTGDGRAYKKPFYGPDCVKGMATILGKEFLGDEPPQQWIDQENIEKEFGVHASVSALEIIKRRSGTLILNHTGTFNDLRYVSPKVAKEIAKLVTPPEDWMTGSDIATNLGTDEATVEAIIQDLKEVQPSGYGANSRLCYVDNQEVFYYRRGAFQLLIKRQLLKTQEDQVAQNPLESSDDTQEMKEDEVVLVPHFDTTVLPRVERDPFGSVEFSEVIRLPQRRPGRYRMGSARLDRNSGRTQVQPTPLEAGSGEEVVPQQQIIGSSYLKAFRRFGR